MFAASLPPETGHVRNDLLLQGEGGFFQRVKPTAGCSEGRTVWLAGREGAGAGECLGMTVASMVDTVLLCSSLEDGGLTWSGPEFRGCSPAWLWGSRQLSSEAPS